MKNTEQAKRAGFTMVEIIVVLAIVGLIATVTGWYVFAGRTEATTASRNIFFHEARRGLTRIVSDLRKSQEIQAILDDKGIEYRDENGDIVSLTLQGNTIVRKVDQQEEVIANHVTAFSVKTVPPVIRKTLDIFISCGPDSSQPGDSDNISLNTAIFIR